MANFTTHLTVASVASTALVMVGLFGGLFGLMMAIFCLGAGVIGGLLPDIDLETSTPAKKFFNAISLAIATLTAILYTAYHQTNELVMLAIAVWVGAYFVVRYGVIGLFSHLTVHRGMVHSVPYMAMCGLLTVHGVFYGLRLNAHISWLLGLFLFLGSLVHLLLDEMYSVNVWGLKLKKSAGTAFKFFERKKPIAYLCLYLFLGVLWYYAPDYEYTLFAIKKTWLKIHALSLEF